MCHVGVVRFGAVIVCRNGRIETLCDKVSRGGSLLLNVGPDATGFISPIMEERLLAMGRWLKVNGEAIYATTGNHAWTFKIAR